MIRGAGRAENRAAIEERRYLLLRGGHLLVPKLEAATVRSLPVFVRIN